MVIRDWLHLICVPTTVASPHFAGLARWMMRSLYTRSSMAQLTKPIEGIVNVNSLFTLALFLGIITTTNTLIRDDNAACAAGASISKGFIELHVYSFSSFLFSSLIALALKNIMNFSKDVDNGEIVLDNNNNNNNWVHSVAKINTVVLRLGTLVLAFGSVFRCGFLVIALVDLVQNVGRAE
ncbi:hypothetical protein JHK82_032920 [Glycine max]|nr:hypothetical protein JHK85_033622 [Glycine max]KAG4985316.1 hypothetical protein JHK86_033007 [Glycine max]KAG5118500.1 hypothetical protein JHK82_032920 [Glycine max]KAG5139483.1 hypothetical protein JHK84_033251 [Glycine max]